MRKTLQRMGWLIPSVALVCCAGCRSTEVVVVRDADPVQLADDVQAYVFVEKKDAAGNVVRVKSDKKATLHKGQWVVSDPGE